MITLIIVDCQNDFISGTLAVKGAKETVNNIKEFIRKNVDNIEQIIFTVDWHPSNHCSFKKNGGIWPTHCVQFTPGACIEPKLLKLVQYLNIKHYFLTKGNMPEVEEYGAFSDIEYCQDALGSRYYFDSVLKIDMPTEFVVCGIAGDYCVKHCTQNLLKGDIEPKLLKEGIVSIDGGTKLDQFIKEYGLKYYE